VKTGGAQTWTRGGHTENGPVITTQQNCGLGSRGQKTYIWGGIQKGGVSILKNEEEEGPGYRGEKKKGCEWVRTTYDHSGEAFKGGK